MANVDVVNIIDIVDNVDNVDEVDKIPRKIYIRQNIFENCSEEEFFRRFRLTKATTLVLLEKIEENLEYYHNR